MIFRIVLVSLFFFSFITAGNKSDVIQWNAARRLSWSDFKGEPPINASNAALTSSGILINFSTNGQSFHYELSCNFDKNNSWGRVKNDYILSHEQGHFDIAEIYTRKLNKALKRYRYRAASFNKDVNAIYRNTMSELQQMQNEYDRQTDYSRNPLQQRKWLARIDNYLDDLKAFSDYK